MATLTAVPTTGGQRRHWRDYSPAQRRAIIAAGALQTTLAVSAWWDLAHRPAEQLTGPKPFWACMIGVNFVGPVAYFFLGRKRP